MTRRWKYTPREPDIYKRPYNFKAESRFMGFRGSPAPSLRLSITPRDAIAVPFESLHKLFVALLDVLLLGAFHHVKHVVLPDDVHDQ
eukprot:CAMPEP_0205924170 /NCGR_PEP_ID=MMETSP1325-20131115/16818_1 /ASSEMBLY_ACC=CAM_ASM_000708 /TAXON_ID=236786 /ORGANISM="Florenciella sp., Strain RCC1007" /LENGTH=86 /DNA_ID=CAMNT_0053292483 /DNA_START=73 /DNA_END=334 /DNA_ORIENTATION=+